MDQSEKTNTLKAVETILRNRRGADLRAHEEEIESLAKVITGVADEETRGRVDRHLESCAECREVLVTLQWADSPATEGPDVGSERPRQDKRASSAGLRWVAVSAAAAMILGFAWLLSTLGEKTAPTDSRMGLKGTDDNLTLVVGRGASRYVLKPLDTLETNDQIGLFYSTLRDGYLLVFALDDAGETSLLFPAGGAQSAPIRTGDNLSLPDGALVEAGSGCEWIIGVFSDAPLRVSDVTRAIENRKRTDGRCGIEIKVTAARTVKVVPFVR
jgi:hypothetical protein